MDIDYEDIKKRLKVIDDSPCGDRFNLILDLDVPEEVMSAIATDWWKVYSAAHEDAFSVLVDLIEEASYIKRLNFKEMRNFHELLLEGIRVYGDGKNGTASQVNWGDNRRAGRYVHPQFDERGMVMETAPALNPDGSPIFTKPRGGGVPAEPAWWAQYIRHLNKEKWFEATVQDVIFSKVNGFGPAFLWGGHDPDEQDYEFFPEEPKGGGTVNHNLIRCALHIRWDGAPSITYNVSNHKGLNHVHEVDGLGERPIDFAIRQESDNAGGKVYTWVIDGEIRQQIESAHLERLHGKKMQNAVNRTNPTIDISTNIGSAYIDTGWGEPHPGLAGAYMCVEGLYIRKAGVVQETL